MIDTLKQEGMKKAVLSRTITIPCDSLRLSPAIFEQMKQYHHAFLFFAAIPGKCAWMGASPETFLKYDRNGFFTMSLAGTQPVATAKNPPEWGDKDIEEQQIVTDYIQDTLRHFFTRHLEIEGPITLQAGNVFHLCTFSEVTNNSLPTRLTNW